MESRWEQLRAWWPVAAVVVGAIGFLAIYLQLGTAIRETRSLEESVVSMHERLVALEETTSQLRLDAIGAQMRGGARPARLHPMPDADGQPGGTKAKAKAGKAKAKAGKAKAARPEGGAAKVGKGKAGKAKRGKAKAKVPPEAP